MDILKRYGVNAVRLRLCNNPYSEDGKPYGGRRMIWRLQSSWQSGRRKKAWVFCWMITTVISGLIQASSVCLGHGATENLTSQLQTIAETYGKKEVVLETSYAYTNDDGDGFANSVSMETENVELRYEINQQGRSR